MSSLIGSTLGSYRLDALVGTGNVGQVFRATHTHLGTLVALKVLNRELTTDQEFKIRFLEHAQTVTPLNHPNILKVFHFVEHEDHFCIVMELLTGGSLESRSSYQPSTEWNRSFWSGVELVQQAAEGLAAAHAKGVVHGSLKPSNLLLAQNETGALTTKVADFGVFQLFKERGVGNSGYLAPEQKGGGLPDPRSDLYSLGAILYEMTTRRPAFQNQDATGRGATEVLPPRQVMAQFPEGLESVILRCLSPDPSQRIASSAEFSNVLRELLDLDRRAPEKKPAQRGQAPAPPPKLNPHVPCVHILDADGVKLSVRHLGGSGVVIGSSPDNDIILRSGQVSPKHARIDWDGVRVTVTDLGSSTSTFLRGQRLLPQVPQEWIADQWVAVGSFWLWLELPGDDGPRPIIEVLLDQTSKNMVLTPGRQSVCRVFVVNRKPQVDAVFLTVENFPEQWIEGIDREMRFQPFERKELALNINVPKEPASRAGDHNIRIRANSRSSPALEQGSATGTWTVAAFEGLSLNLVPPKAAGRRQARYNLTVQHEGNNSPASYVLTARDDEKQLEFSFSTAKLTDRGRLQLDFEPPGSHEQVKLKVNASRRWAGASALSSFTVQAASPDGKNVHTTEAQFVHRAIFPTWSVALAPILLAALVVVVLYMGKPSVRKFVTTPQGQAKAGDLITVTWDAPYATRIKLTQDQNQVDIPNEPQGKWEFRIDKDTTLEMVASNIFGDSPAARATLRLKPKDPLPLARIDMTVSPLNITRGDSVTINWKVEGGSRVDSSWMGTVPLQGSYTDNPDSNRVYILTAFNADNQPTTKQLGVNVAVLGPMLKPVLRRTDARTRLTQGDTVTFSWEARNAQEMRIVGAGSTVQLEGSTGQKRARLKAKGTYSFTLIAKDDKGNEVSSDAVSFEAVCTIRDTARCNNVPQVEWVP